MSLNYQYECVDNIRILKKKTEEYNTIQNFVPLEL